jgi:hypothetical protein
LLNSYNTQAYSVSGIKWAPDGTYLAVVPQDGSIIIFSPFITPATPTPTMARTPYPTITSTSTNTPTSTPTRTPTASAIPAQTPIAPIHLSGFGDASLHIDKWIGPAIIRADSSADGVFQIRLHGEDAVSTSWPFHSPEGFFSGTSIIDAYSNQHSEVMVVKAPGAWDVEILPLDDTVELTEFGVPGILEGEGSDLIHLSESTYMKMTFLASQETLFDFKINLLSFRNGVLDWVGHQATVGPGSSVDVIIPSNVTHILIDTIGMGAWTIEIALIGS